MLGVEEDDILQIATWGLWEALRRWEPAKGARSTYCVSYISGYVLKQQSDLTRAIGWNKREGRSLASVISLENKVLNGDDGLTIGETLQSPEDVAGDAEATATLAAMQEAVAAMPQRERTIAEYIIDARSIPTASIAREFGVTPQRVFQIAEIIRAALKHLAGVSHDG